MKLADALELGEQSWGHYTAWRTVIKNLRKLQTENRNMRRELKSYRPDGPYIWAETRLGDTGKNSDA